MILFTVTPGPTLNLWRDGELVERKEMTIQESLLLLQQLTNALRGSI